MRISSRFKNIFKCCIEKLEIKKDIDNLNECTHFKKYQWDFYFVSVQQKKETHWPKSEAQYRCCSPPFIPAGFVCFSVFHFSVNFVGYVREFSSYFRCLLPFFGSRKPLVIKTVVELVIDRVKMMGSVWTETSSVPTFHHQRSVVFYLQFF